MVPRAGKTRIRVSETLRASAGGIFGGLMGGLGDGSIGPWLGVGASLSHYVLGVELWLATVAVTYLGARGLFGMHSRARSRALRAMAERLAAQARESIDFATPKLQAPSGRQVR